MSIDPAFVTDCPYGPGGLLIDEILAIDPEQNLVRARMPTHDELPLTREQRAHPQRHPRHVSGGLMVHVTGMMGFVHAYYVLNLRHADGWIGYGTRIHDAKFKSLATTAAPLELECRATQVRKISGNIFVRYLFKFTQGENVVYQGDQSAIWSRVAT
jgi:hypothetical protein